MSRGSQSLYDRHLTIFSPEGKLYQVEYAFRAVKSCSLTAIAVRGATCACLVVQKKVPLQQAQQDKLLDRTSITSLHHISDSIGAAMIGIPGDCRSMVFRSRDIVNKFEHEMGYPIPVHHLSQKVANLNQVYTQHAYMRLHACCGIFISIDEETKSPAVFRFDPAGWFAGYKACAAGTKEQEATNALEKLLKNKVLSTEKQTVEEAIACLQTILAVDFKHDDVEVAIVTVDDPRFRLLDNDTIDQYLNWIADRD